MRACVLAHIYMYIYVYIYVWVGAAAWCTRAPHQHIYIVFAHAPHPKKYKTQNAAEWDLKERVETAARSKDATLLEGLSQVRILRRWLPDDWVDQRLETVVGVCCPL